MALRPPPLGLLVFFVAPFAAFAVYSFLTGGALRRRAAAHARELPRGARLRRQPHAGAQLARGRRCCRRVIAVAFALPIAYWLRYAAGRWRVLVLFLIVASFFASYLVRIYAWRSDPRAATALLNAALSALGVDRRAARLPALQPLRGHRSRSCTSTCPTSCWCSTPGSAPLQPAYLEAAQDLGAGWVQRWRRVILPLVAAPAASALLFVFVLSAADYVTPQFLGGTNGAMFGVQVQVSFVGTGDYAAGAAIAFAMLAGFLVCLRPHRARPAADPARSDAVRARERHPAQPGGRRLHAARRGLPVGAAAARGAVQPPQHGFAHLPFRGLLAALVRGDLRLAREFASRRRTRSMVATSSAPDHPRAGHAGGLRAGPHPFAPAGVRSPCCSSCPSPCRDCSSG